MYQYPFFPGCREGDPGHSEKGTQRDTEGHRDTAILFVVFSPSVRLCARDLGVQIRSWTGTSENGKGRQKKWTCQGAHAVCVKGRKGEEWQVQDAQGSKEGING